LERPFPGHAKICYLHQQKRRVITDEDEDIGWFDISVDNAVAVHNASPCANCPAMVEVKGLLNAPCLFLRNAAKSVSAARKASTS
jgi:hypothetical protein